jgi:hypothetical protein
VQVSYRWRITGPGTKPAELVGYVEAPDHATAIQEAIRIYTITDRRKRQQLAATQVSQY